MKNAAMNVRSMPSSLRRILTLFVVFAVVLVTLPLQANAQGWTTTSTTAYDTAADDDWATKSTSEPVEQPSATSKASKTSAAHPDDYTEDPALTEKSIEPFDELAETLWPSETMVPMESEGELLIPSDDDLDGVGEPSFEAEMFSPRAFSAFARASNTYTGTSNVPKFWAYQENVPNPAVAQRCGLNVALVFDLSNSIGVGGLESSKAAGRAVVDTLRGATGTKLGIFNFDTYASTMHEGYDMSSQANQATSTINSLRINGGARGGTNWEGGLREVLESSVEYQVVYFITDGVPTTNDLMSPGSDNGAMLHNQDIYKAIDKANDLKRGGARLEVLAVGMDSTLQTVLRDDVRIATYQGVQDLGNFIGRQLDTSDPRFRYGNVDDDSETRTAINNGALLTFGSTFKVLGGADVTATSARGTSTVDRHTLPNYNHNRPTGEQIARSLTLDVTNVANYSELERQLTRMLPAPCIANVVVKKNVVDQLGNKDNSVSLKDWEFEFGKLPSGFTYQSGYQSKVKTDSNGRAEWRFNTSTPTENGKVDITELVNANVDSRLQKVVCTDRQDAEIPVEVNGQKFSIKLVAGQTYTCEVVNQIPGHEIEKIAAEDQNPDVPGNQPSAVVDAQGNFTVRYQIRITNLSNSPNPLHKSFTDTPVFPTGFSVTDASFVMVNGNPVNVKRSGNTWELSLIDDSKPFGPGQVRAINVVMTGKANAAALQSISNGTYAKCESGGGLRNRISMDGDLDKSNNEACVDVTIEDILLKLLKVDHNDVSQALGGAQFTLFKANGDQIGEQVAVFEPGSKDGSHSTRVELGAEYFIVETRAPENYSLLPAPIRIAVNAGQNGVEVKVLNPNEAFSATPKVSEEPGVAILQVADLQSGALPKSGGMGVVPIAVVALLILGLGAYMLRRRM